MTQDTWLQTTKSPCHRTQDYRQQSPHDTGHLTTDNKIPMTQNTWLQTIKSPWHRTPDYNSPHDTGHLTTTVPMTQDTWLQTMKSPWHRTPDSRQWSPHDTGHLITDNKVPMTHHYRQQSPHDTGHLTTDNHHWEWSAKQLALVQLHTAYMTEGHNIYICQCLGIKACSVH